MKWSPAGGFAWAAAPNHGTPTSGACDWLDHQLTALAENTTTSGEIQLMLKLLREIHQFFVDCLEALQDEEERFKRQQRKAADRQKQWLDYLYQT
jgi:hypothetical protein